MRRWLGNTLRGVCMGAADVIPGVSGGTVALILGIYPRLIDAVGGLGTGLLRRVRRGSFWRLVAAGVRNPNTLGEAGRPAGDREGDREGRDADRVLFLAFLAAGILPAIAVGARILPPLLSLYPAQMRGLFLGLVLASVTVPLRAMRRGGVSRWLLGLGAALLTVWFVGLPEPTSERATGSVSLVFDEPTAAAVRLTPQNLVLRAPADDERPELVFGPAGSTDVPAGSAGIEVAVIASMTGGAGNVPAGTIREVEGPVAGMSVSQPGPLGGGRDPSAVYLILGGVLAISAMALPGISGSFVLLLLGLYHYVLYTLSLAIYHQHPGAVLTVGAMAAAMAAGLLTFARVLRRLFARWHDATLAVLVGLMLGSLRKLWPFTRYTDEGREVAAMPAPADPEVVTVGLLFVAGVGAVLLLDAVGRRRSLRDSNPGPAGQPTGDRRS